ncbi:MAG: methyltransferase domain-containing protein [Parcubacteria group bacterium]|nr:methyltransferase domain-containing protein [Parcubacteria group bacterium]
MLAKNQNHSLLEGKMQADYDAVAAAFSQSRREMRWPEVDALVAEVKPGGRVLDLGCGTGRLYGFLQEKDVQYLGLDISPQQIAQAKQVYPAGSFIVSSMTDLPVADASQDVVFMIASLHHLLTPANRAQAVQEAWRVLHPGGRVFVTVMNLWPRKYWSLFFHKSAGLATLTPEERRQIKFKDVFLPWTWKLNAGQRVYRYYHAFTKGELRRLFARAGFTIDQVGNTGKNLVLKASKNV